MVDRRKLAREVRAAIFEDDAASSRAFVSFCETLGHYRQAVAEWHGRRDGPVVALEYDVAEAIVGLSLAIEAHAKRRRPVASGSH